MEDKADHNYVADAQNWEQRVKSELDASKQWYSDWGSLYAPQEPTDYKARIAKLEQVAKNISGERLGTANSEYGTGKPYKEFAKQRVKKPDLI